MTPLFLISMDLIIKETIGLPLLWMKYDETLDWILKWFIIVSVQFALICCSQLLFFSTTLLYTLIRNIKYIKLVIIKTIRNGILLWSFCQLPESHQSENVCRNSFDVSSSTDSSTSIYEDYLYSIPCKEVPKMMHKPAKEESSVVESYPLLCFQ